jgi:hypothetical protein
VEPDELVHANAETPSNREVNVAVVYTAVTGGPITSEFISRFVATWMAFPPGAECDLWIACNGGPLSTEQSLMFLPMSARMFPRVNDAGYDLSGYMDAARGACRHYDAMLCLGESVYFHREGWLRRLTEAWQKWGPGFYGPFSSNAVRSHLNTTAFFCAPSLLGQYPFKVSTKKDRYEFEHGTNAMWRRAAARGLPVRLVTWDGEWPPQIWRLPQNILWRGDQSNLLMRCNHTDKWENASPWSKQQWSAWADRVFK